MVCMQRTVYVVCLCLIQNTNTDFIVKFTQGTHDLKIEHCQSPDPLCLWPQ